MAKKGISPEHAKMLMKDSLSYIIHILCESGPLLNSQACSYL